MVAHSREGAESMANHLRNISKSKAPSEKTAHKKKFIFLKRVYLSDINIQGGVYFARFFDWQGMAREEFFRVAVPIQEAFFSAGYQLLTVEAAIEYKSPARLYDEIEIAISIGWLKRASAELRFTFDHRETGERLALGRQVIACADRNGKIIAAPQGIKDLLVAYCE
jgi:YbgC/YbaW family acyl-CoA thioester hydrolase